MGLFGKKKPEQRQVTAAELEELVKSGKVKEATISAVKIHGPNSATPGVREDLGVISRGPIEYRAEGENDAGKR